MRPYQIFAALSEEDAEHFFRGLSESAPAAFAQCVGLAAGAMKARPVFIQRMPFERRARAARRALARVVADEVAEEMLAVYFLECRNEVLVAWLDEIGLEHDEGTLAEDAPKQPAKQKLRDAVAAYRKAASDDAADRELLLRAFAAQRSIDWPELDAILAG